MGKEEKEIISILESRELSDLEIKNILEEKEQLIIPLENLQSILFSLVLSGKVVYSTKDGTRFFSKS